MLNGLTCSNSPGSTVQVPRSSLHPADLSKCIPREIWQKHTREEPHAPVCRLTLPPIIRHGLYLDDSFSLAERDLVLLRCIVAAPAHCKSHCHPQISVRALRTRTMQLQWSPRLEVLDLVLARLGEAAAVEEGEEELPQVLAPVPAQVHPLVRSIRRSWLAGGTVKQPLRTWLPDTPGNNPFFAPFPPTPDHHPSSTCSISSISSPSTSSISFSSVACKRYTQCHSGVGGLREYITSYSYRTIAHNPLPFLGAPAEVGAGGGGGGGGINSGSGSCRLSATIPGTGAGGGGGGGGYEFSVRKKKRRQISQYDAREGEVRLPVPVPVLVLVHFRVQAGAEGADESLRVVAVVAGPEGQAMEQCRLALNSDVRNGLYLIPIILFLLVLRSQCRDTDSSGDPCPNSQANCSRCFPLRCRDSGGGRFEAGSFATVFLFSSLLFRQCLPLAPGHTGPLNRWFDLLLLLLFLQSFLCAFLKRINESLGFGKLDWFPVRSHRSDTIFLDRLRRSDNWLWPFPYGLREELVWTSRCGWEVVYTDSRSRRCRPSGSWEGWCWTWFKWCWCWFPIIVWSRGRLNRRWCGILGLESGGCRLGPLLANPWRPSNSRMWWWWGFDRSFLSDSIYIDFSDWGVICSHRPNRFKLTGGLLMD